MSALQTAKELAEEGWPILAANSNKIPLHRWGETQLTAEDIARYFSDTSNMVGIITGQRSGIFVIDPDEKDGKGGIATFLAAGNVPATFTVETRSGGRHYYFRHPGAGTSIVTKSDILPGVDVRGDGGYVVAPGNDGYRVIDRRPIADAPEWLLRLVAKQGLPGVETIPEPINPLTTEEHAKALRRAEIYLSNLDANCDRDKWLSALMAVHAMTHGSAEGFEVADRWSATGGERYKGSKDVARRWRSFTFDRTGGIGEGTLRHLTRGTNAALEIAFPDIPVGNFLPIASEAPRERPKVYLSVELHEVADITEAALIADGTPFYQRGGTLRQPVQTDAGMILSEVEARTVQDKMSRAARFIVVSDDKKTGKPVESQVKPPLEIASIIMSRNAEWKFPVVNGIISAPTMRPDGSLILRSGFDAATGLIVSESIDLPVISETPTRDEALTALQLIRDLFNESPFKDEASRTVAVSAVMTAVLRGALDRAPLHAFSAPEAGTGKSFACDIAAAVIYGSDSMRSISMGSRHEEFEKRLVTEIMAGQPTILIDNVNRAMGGEFFCQAIERPEVSMRVLGKSESRTARNTHTLFATGNNLRVLDDVVRRTVRAQLDAGMESPWRRKFTGNPIATVRADRGRYLAAVFTIARAYAAAGEPVVADSFGSFGEWSRRVRQPLIWLGMADPLLTQDELKSDDDARDVLAIVLANWPTGQIYTARELVSEANSVSTEFTAALQQVPAGSPQGSPLDVQKLGTWLKNNAGKIIDGRKIVFEKDSHTKTNKYRVELAGF
ncbi:hypothetical protein NA8A_05593 [Nitratireductor indicus C115]|uniref:DNA primase/polymerase bifunctional N-terminal domain-containing protein n=1 Tax=Nitratireductor indicus C115 TaxID=1231190 RepID=K2NVV3_9HYPH|nr:bifunctional DNA primase/polymerase [Nitratireductor indicus]EKF43480.1 hypothetical protein NA8A_05593 [Nitratireductor indicus C115]SFQ06723.1 Primase C terminal 2 (PriCT-2) [Nitratireductor indicus]